MEQALSVFQVRALEDKARQLGFDDRRLIEGAASNLARITESLALGKKVMVVAGRGNNGADVLCCACRLLEHGFTVTVVLLQEKVPGAEVLFWADELVRAGLSIRAITAENINSFDPGVEDVDFVLDGILGIGASGEVSALVRQVIEKINQSKKPVVACDVPSGLCADDGKILGAAVKAAYTVTFIAPKRGFFLNQGRQVCGRIFVADIGVSRQELEMFPA